MVRLIRLSCAMPPLPSLASDLLHVHRSQHGGQQCSVQAHHWPLQESFPGTHSNRQPLTTRGTSEPLNMVSPQIIWPLVRLDGSGRMCIELSVVAAAAFAAGMALWGIAQHLRCFVWPEMQKYYVRILAFIPISCLACTLSFLYPQVSVPTATECCVGGCTFGNAGRGMGVQGGAGRSRSAACPHSRRMWRQGR